MTVLLLLAWLPAQDSVAALVEKMKADDIQVVVDAQEDLIRLGADAVPAIRTYLEAASADLKARLEAAIRQIEQNARIETALGPGLRVTLRVADKPVSAVLDELKRASEQPIACKDVPADRISISLEKALFWDALDEVCRKHGGIMWSVSQGEIQVRCRPWRKLPRVTRGNVVFVLDGMESSRDIPAGDSYFRLDAAVCWVRKAPVQWASLHVDELVDDRQTNLTRKDEARWGRPYHQDEGDQLTQPLYVAGNAMPHVDATSLRVQGVATAIVVLKSEELFSIEKPADAAGREHVNGELSLSLQSFERTGNSIAVRARLRLSPKHGEHFVKPSNFSIRDSDGKAYAGTGRYVNDSEWSIKGNPTHVRYELRFDVPAESKVMALKVIAPSAQVALELPFNFRAIPIR